jgi:hypothetical protein
MQYAILRLDALDGVFGLMLLVALLLLLGAPGYFQASGAAPTCHPTWPTSWRACASIRICRWRWALVLRPANKAAAVTRIAIIDGAGRLLLMRRADNGLSHAGERGRLDFG